MKIPLSWLKEYIDIELNLEELARTLTLAGLEVEEIRLAGLPKPAADRYMFKYTGLSWDREHFVVAQIDEVMPHPNADRLTLCRLNDGQQELIVLTGAPNLFEYKGAGPLARPLKVAYAREGATLYDGHQPGEVLTTLKRVKIRGVESFSMVCSEKELGISEEHEGIILLDADAPTGMPLVDYLGDAVLVISILPNMIRNASVIGVARELSALTGKPLRQPGAGLLEAARLAALTGGEPIDGKAAVQITEAELNPRFVLGLIRGVEPRPSPYRVQHRLRLAGMRPINSIVDATNYVMLETGEPLHAFDYDVLIRRAGGKPPTIITRRAQKGEKLTTLDGVERTLDDFTILVTDTAGPLSLAGVMGGMESEVTENTRNVLLEGASWNFVNIRRTAFSQRLSSEAGYRFSRGVHPALAEIGVMLGLARMAAWSGGQIAPGLVDAYPLPPVDPIISLSPADVRRILGINLSPEEIAALLERLGFTCRTTENAVLVQTPPHRLDISEGSMGKADLLEEIARIYGYERIPAARLAEPLPPPRPTPDLQLEARVREGLARLGLQEIVSYRMTTPEREARLAAPDAPAEPQAYIRLLNPITPERSVMRRSLLSSVLDAAERNLRVRDPLMLFEIGPVFLPTGEGQLPEEPQRLAILFSGSAGLPAWDQPAPRKLDFYDLKGALESLLERLHIPALAFEPAAEGPYHPGKCALITSGGQRLGIFGELHPLVKERFDLGPAPVVCAELELSALLAAAPARFETASVSSYPPVLEDIAVVVDESLPAEQVAALIRQTGGRLLVGLRLFDVFRGEQIGAGKKSLAYALTYQAPDHTLNEKEAAQIRQRIIRRLEQELGAKLRG